MSSTNDEPAMDESQYSQVSSAGDADATDADPGLFTLGYQRPAMTGWALKQLRDRLIGSESCPCGTHLSSCAGCGEPRCLSCKPYQAEDCRWLF